jgi:outer membrane protein TolC
MAQIGTVAGWHGSAALVLALLVSPMSGRQAAAGNPPDSAPKPQSGYEETQHAQEPLPHPNLVKKPDGSKRTVAVLPIDLPYALRLVNASNPTIAAARERIRQAYARQQQAQVLWVPNLWTGGNPDNSTFLPNYFVHDGRVQNSRGEVFDTAKAFVAFSSGAGLNFSLADAIFGPRIARDLTAAEEARARVVTFNVQLDVALTYLDLLRVYGGLAVIGDAISKAEVMSQYALQADRAGLSKTTADAQRARTELETLLAQRDDLEGDAAAVSARLAQLLLLDGTADLVPADAQVVPIELVPVDVSLAELVGAGLLNRPELAASRAEVAAALERWRQDRTRPFIPSLQMAYYGAEFGGGEPGLHNYGSRSDYFVQASWELRNAGLGNWFQAREGRSRYNEANFHQVEVQAQVTAEVTAAAKRVATRQRAIRRGEEAVTQALEMWTRLSKAAFGFAGRAGQYDPLEALLAEQGLREARRQYLSEVIEYNREQFRLYWAMGQPPVDALPCAKPLPLRVPVTPEKEKEKKP